MGSGQGPHGNRLFDALAFNRISTLPILSFFFPFLPPSPLSLGFLASSLRDEMKETSMRKREEKEIKEHLRGREGGMRQRERTKQERRQLSPPTRKSV